jgi:hypothetical protein
MKDVLLQGRYQRVPPKRRLTFNGLHGVIFQKIEPLSRHKFKLRDCGVILCLDHETL